MSIITIDFTAQYAGPTRVCWRTGSSGAYDCSTAVNCVGAGAACQAVIDIGPLDNETCEDVTIEGYVQSMCQDVSSLTDRIPFSATFTPTPACNRYEITCDNVGLSSISITDGGSGYDTLDPPPVTITGGGGSGATGTAVLDGFGVLTGIILNTPGSGYTSVPTVLIDPPSPGTQATAVAVLADCPAFSNLGCDASSPAPVLSPVPLATTVAICKQGSAPVLSDQFIVTPDGNCLCECTNYSLSVAGGSPDGALFEWTDCNSSYNQLYMGPGDTYDGCMVTGSLLITPNAGAIYTVTPGAACPAA